jgi:hypothetical protein
MTVVHLILLFVETRRPTKGLNHETIAMSSPYFCNIVSTGGFRR